MHRMTALDQVRGVLTRIKDYVEEHNTLGDIDKLNAKYVPQELQDEVDWVTEMVGRLLDTDPTDDSDDAVEVPPRG